MQSHRNIRRRFLRFRLRTLLLLPLFFAVAWWWVTWPERTARRFVELVQSGEIGTAQAMCLPPQGADALWALTKVQGATIGKAIFVRPTWREVVAAQRRFGIPCTVASTTIVLDDFTATRNFVATNPENSQRALTIYTAKHSSAFGLATTLSQNYSDPKSFQFVVDERLNRISMRVPKQLLTHILVSTKKLDHPRPIVLGLFQRPLPPEEMEALMNNLSLLLNQKARSDQQEFWREMKQRIPDSRDQPLLRL